MGGEPPKYRVLRRTPFYTTGPQQGRPEDGWFDAGQTVLGELAHPGGATGYVWVSGPSGAGWTAQSDLQLI